MKRFLAACATVLLLWGSWVARADDPNVVTGTCAEFVSHIFSPGVLDANNVFHMEYAGATTHASKFEESPGGRLNYFTRYQSRPKAALACAATTVSGYFKADPKTTQMHWVPSPAGCPRAKCDAVAAYIDDTISKHEAHHRDSYVAVAKTHVWNNRYFEACTLRPIKHPTQPTAAEDMAAEKVLVATVLAAISAEKDEISAEDSAADDAFHNTPEGAPLSVPCSDCQVCNGCDSCQNNQCVYSCSGCQKCEGGKCATDPAICKNCSTCTNGVCVGGGNTYADGVCCANQYCGLFGGGGWIACCPTPGGGALDVQCSPCGNSICPDNNKCPLVAFPPRRPQPLLGDKP